MQDAPWSVARAWDLAKHLPIPAVILGLAGTAQQIRIMRANLLDELRKPYVVTARAKGLVRAARDPQVSGAGGAQSVREHDRLHAAVHRLRQHHRVARARACRRSGPLLLKALIAQDMFLAGTIVLLLGVMTVIGTLISDILLVWIDPRIRLEET